MTMNWNQRRWINVRGVANPVLWEGQRSDGRSFYVRYKRGMYVCVAYNGGKPLGTGSTLAEAQKHALKVPPVMVRVSKWLGR